MFYYVRGKLTLLDPAFAVIDANGVGYRLTISQTTHSLLSKNSTSSKNDDVTLYSYMAVREDGVELFGFGTVDELDAFKLLITVSGVGPKAAIAILSQLPPQKLSVAICSEDKKAISMANGIGPKTAARVILELKDKLTKAPIGADSDDSFEAAVSNTIGAQSKLSDAQDALMALGYSRNEAYNVLKTLDTANLELDDIIRLALKKMMK